MNELKDYVDNLSIEDIIRLYAEKGIYLSITVNPKTASGYFPEYPAMESLDIYLVQGIVDGKALHITSHDLKTALVGVLIHGEAIIREAIEHNMLIPPTEVRQ